MNTTCPQCGTELRFRYLGVTATRCPECKAYLIRQHFSEEELPAWFELALYAIGIVTFVTAYFLTASELWALLGAMGAMAGFSACLGISAHRKIPPSGRRWELDPHPLRH